MSVLGFPCNQFGSQEPGSNEEILEFVTTKYDIDFPMFSKIDVNGDDAAELFIMLKDQQPGEDESSNIKWNFEKFLVDGEGNAVARWGTGVTPEQIRAELSNFL